MTSLCDRCLEARETANDRGSRFIYCRALPIKYPRQPVLRCVAFRPKEEEASVKGRGRGGR